MKPSQLVGLLVVVLAGFCIGLAPLPLKRMRQYQYEHWAFIAMLVGLIVIPWSITIVACPGAWQAVKAVGPAVLVRANLFSIGWGIANILYLQCLIRIGVSLTSGIVGGMTVALGVVMPMIFKGTGTFQEAPGLDSLAGWTVLAGVGIMLLAVILAAMAGRAREAGSSGGSARGQGFAGGLAMAITAGFLGSGISFAFVYSQGPIIQAMKDHGAGDTPAAISVWALALLGGALANVFYPAYLLTRNRSWRVFGQHPQEIGMAALFGAAFIAGFLLLGKGMLLLGALGASVGFGVQQSVQMLGNQAVGFAAGEWRNAPVARMYCALGLLLLAIGVLSIGNAVARP